LTGSYTKPLNLKGLAANVLTLNENCCQKRTVEIKQNTVENELYITMDV
jgi:hypothetical protein